MQTEAIPHVRSLAGQIEAIHPVDARLSRFLLDARCGSLLGDGFEGLRFATVMDEAAAGVYQLRAHSDAGEIRALFTAPDSPSVALAARADTPPELKGVAAEAALGPLVEIARRLGISGFSIRAIEAVEDSAPARQARRWFTVADQHGEIARFARMVVPEAAYPVAGTEWAIRHPLSAIGSRLPMVGRVSLCVRDLCVSLLHSLRIGDVLLLPLQGIAGTQVSVRWGSCGATCLSARARLEERSLTFEGEAAMVEDDPGGEAALGASLEMGSLAEMELPVRFELETVAIPLGELHGISPGYVIELSAPVSQASVRLVACGQTIGHAELVAVGDRLGARVTRMVIRDESESSH
jgi:type III secretion protein Q